MISSTTAIAIITPFLLLLWLSCAFVMTDMTTHATMASSSFSTTTGVQSSDSTIPVVYYVQPLLSTLDKSKTFRYNLTNGDGSSPFMTTSTNYFCGPRQDPCHSIREALQVIIDRFQRNETNSLSGRLVLLPSSNGNLIYSTEQCKIMLSGYCQLLDDGTEICEPFSNLLIESESEREIIMILCKDYLFLNLYVKHLTFQNLNMSSTHFNNNGTQWLTFENVHMTDLGMYKFGPEMEETLVTIKSSFVKNVQIKQTEQVQIEHSNLELVEIGNEQTFISISNSVLRSVRVHLPNIWKDKNEKFQIVNSTLYRTQFQLQRVRNVVLENVKLFERTAIHVSNTDYLRLVAVQALGGSFQLFARNVVQIGIVHSQFHSLQLLDSVSNYLIEIYSNSMMHVTNCSFMNNQGNILGLTFLETVYMDTLTFKNNIGRCMVVDLPKKPKSGSNVVLSSSSFHNTTCERMKTTTTTNWQLGCVLNIHAGEMIIQKMECSGTRGALNGACINALAESSFWVAHSTFSDNLAHQFGGAIYIDVPIVRPPLFENISCTNNEAGYAGGCLYFHTSKQLRSAEWIGNNIYSQNIAQSYGNDIASPLYGVKYDLQIQYQDGKMTIFNASSNSIPKLELYPGQVISSMQVSVWNNGQERIHFLDSEISTLKFSLNDSSSMRVSHHSLTTSIMDDPFTPNHVVLLYDHNRTHPLILQDLSILVYQLPTSFPFSIQSILSLNDENPLSIQIQLQECPQGMRLQLQQYPTNSYACRELTRIAYEVIIPVVAIVSILIFSCVVIIFYVGFRMIRNIYRKLKRLKQKELAERRMESKLLEKRIIFMDDEDELVLDEMDHSSLLKDTGATEIKMNYISSTRYGADMKDSLLMNEMTPQRRNQHKGRNVTSSSSLHQHWIISIEDVEIVKRISEGANGTVYLGLWKGTRVALKSLKSNFMDHPLHSSLHHEEEENRHLEENDEFEKEASLLASIRHPNIVQFFGVIVSGSRKYMVVEFMEKKSLDLAIYNSKNGIEKLSIFRKIDILLGVAKGMQYLHAMKPFGGIIHRDLKPGNILLDKNFTAKIADFGLSKHLSTRNASNFSTSNQESNATANVGTLFYMSNEMISGTKYNHKTDVYSFGIVMWELFFEENPYLNAHSKKLHHFTTQRFTNNNSNENVTGMNTIMANPGLSDIYGFQVLSQVVNGLRPIIPFQSRQEMRQWLSEFMLDESHRETSPKDHGDVSSLDALCNICEEYMSLMKACWDPVASQRPEFVEICQRLNGLLEGTR